MFIKQYLLVVLTTEATLCMTAPLSKDPQNPHTEYLSPSGANDEPKFMARGAPIHSSEGAMTSSDINHENQIRDAKKSKANPAITEVDKQVDRDPGK